MTKFVTAKVSHPTGRTGKDGVTADGDGYLIVPGEMDLFMVNTSAEKLSCRAVPVRNGFLVKNDEKIVYVQPYEDNLGKPRVEGRTTWWGGYSSTDSVRYSCTLMDDGNSGTCNLKALGLQ